MSQSQALPSKLALSKKREVNEERGRRKRNEIQFVQSKSKKVNFCPFLAVTAECRLHCPH